MYTKDNIEAFVLTYNRKDMLKESITSLLNQSIGDISITVMDNGSNDGTMEMLQEMMEEFPNLHYFKHDENRPQMENFKKAVELAKCDYTIFFHDDDILHPDYLKFALGAINKFPNTAIVSSCYQEWSEPTNGNWTKVSQRFDYCVNKKMFVNYLYRMQRYAYPNTVYKTKNLKNHIFDMEYYSQFGKIVDKPFVTNTMMDNDGAVIFRSKKLLRYRVHAGQDTRSSGPYYDEIIAYNKYCKNYMQNSWYSKLMYNITNYKQLRRAYEWGRDYTLSLNEFIAKAIEDGGGCEWTKLCILPFVGKIFIEIAHIARKFLKTPYKRVFSL